MSESPENSAPLERDAPANEPDGRASQPLPPPVDSVPPAPAWTPPAADAASSPYSSVASVASDRPEMAVAAAFAGGLVLALILKRLGR